jgi:hypothetical protein
MKKMLQAAKPGSELLFPHSESEFAQVREQLERLLVHPLFHHSKRYPALLRYAVEQTLLGNGDQLKERNIGIEVFGRDPNYDTNADPVVRFTASEIRKRLALYYVDPAHSGELQVDLPIGSYAAAFNGFTRRDAPHDSEDELTVDAISVAPISAVNELPALRPVPAQVAVPRRHRIIVASAVLCAVLVAIAGLCTGIWLYLPSAPGWLARLHTNPMDQFWSPTITAPGTATFCIGEPNGPAGEDSGQSAVLGSSSQPLHNELRLSGHLAIADVVTLTHLATALDARGKNFRISTASQASFSQLREGPVILVGAFDNSWTQRLTQDLRFNFISQDGVASIVDRRNPTQTHWSTSWEIPYQKLSRDYGVIARFHDPTTGQPVVLVAGISAEGTEAAGEFLSNPRYFAELLQRAPRNWPALNMEVVIETQVIDGHPGPPRILAVEFW